ncbi:MAG: N-acetyl-gamma-glutamyl-phosphate reductase, partial [Clostridiales bacterium]|nr:N-acetyl-gamma-glutamyl-phosphate reductase [Clostridiales bacterium]
ALVKNPKTVVLDTSTAHRTEKGWAYGFPELSPKHRQAVVSARRIAVPGCHASGFIALIYPLVAAGLLPKNALLTCFSLTGYTGGGKKMIGEYTSPERPALYDAPRQYGLTQQHKHLKEMVYMTGLRTTPLFCPVVADYDCGMEMTVPLFASRIRGTAADVAAVYRAAYQGPVVLTQEGGDESGFLSAKALSGKDSMLISVFGNADRILLTARYDNLGKGASGAALECMNLAFGWEETKNLSL